MNEAEAVAAGLPDVAAQLHASDPELYPATIWADWLCGDHKTLHRRRPLGEFAAGIATDGNAEIERRRAEGLPVESSAGALSDERREQLEEIGASWCPSRPVTWQRCFHLARMHLDSGEALPTATGEVLRQGENLGRWVQSVRLGWDQLTTVQQWMCEQVLGIEPATEDEKPPPRRTQADKWAMNYEAAKQFYEREGHLQVPRKHVERIVGEDQEEREHKLGAWIGNQRSRAATLTPERMEQLSAIGMRCRDGLRLHRGHHARGRLSARAAAPVAAGG
ncbi:helicase associated domain-containing protein [Streptomyces sp. NPDC014991]|uniref:helicase associated domain-containing protein n=1 Tax=Streptomyces sp. NPDC014991 TaxID=3364935 RepID=UPI0037026973